MDEASTGPGGYRRRAAGAERPDWSLLDGMLSDLKRTMANLPDIQRRMLAVTGEAWSEDRMVRALVGPRGHLLELDIDPRVYRTPDSKALSATIVATVRQAIEEAGRQAERIYGEGLPTDLRPQEIGGLDLGKILHSHDADVRLDKGGSHE